MTNKKRSLVTLGCVDYSKEQLMDVLAMLRAYLSIVTTDEVIKRHFEEMDEYLYAELQKECNTNGCEIADVRVEYIGYRIE